MATGPASFFWGVGASLADWEQAGRSPKVSEKKRPLIANRVGPAKRFFIRVIQGFPYGQNRNFMDMPQKGRPPQGASGLRGA